MSLNGPNTLLRLSTVLSSRYTPLRGVTGTGTKYESAEARHFEFDHTVGLVPMRERAWPVVLLMNCYFDRA
jgi:hypothetical protein